MLPILAVPPASTMTPLLRVPAEVLEFIALELVLLSPVGPPQLGAFQRTCRAVYDVVNPRNVSLYGRIFKTTFDTTAAARRFGPRVLRSENLTCQLFRNWRALSNIRYHAFHTLEDDFWACYFMLLEDDGKNYQQIQWAGVPKLADTFVRHRLYDGSSGWPAENTINALALWIMWMTIDAGASLP